MEDTPVNAAHAFASAAEEFEEKEQWNKAMEAHFRAAEKFLSAMNYTSDPEAVRTLKLLYANHTRQGKELQRRLSQRVQQSPKQTAQERPSTPPHRKKPSTQSKSNAAVPQPKNNSGMRTQHLQGSSSHPSSWNASGVHTPSNSNGRVAPDLLRSGVNTSGLASSSKDTKRIPAWSDSLSSAVPNNPLDVSAVTEKTIDESYMVLRGNNDSTDDDDMDPFNKFWEIVESLVSKISNPVAFATVPLNGGTDPHILFDPSTIPPPLPFGNNADGENADKDPKVDELNTAMMESYFIIPNEQKPGLGNSSYQRSSSSRMHSSSRKPESKNVPTKTLEEYTMENQQLKSIIDTMSKRMLAYEKAAEENSMLRSSILQFKNDFQKQAKRIKASQEMLRSMSVLKQTSPESSTVGNAHYLQRRIKELEEELRLVKMDNDKQRNLMTKYRERWEKLKESAKKRRVNKQGDPPTQQIVESPSSPKMTNPQKSPSHPKPPQAVSPSSSTTVTATTITTAVATPESRKQSLPEINLPFALQKPSQKSGFGEILDGSTSPKGVPVSPTTTIVRAIGTSSNNSYKNSSNNNVSDSNNNIDSNNSINGLMESNSPTLPFLSRRESGGSVLSTEVTENIVSLSNQREMIPEDESSPSSSMMTAVTSASQSMYQQ